MGILSGLKNFGVDLQKDDIYADNKSDGAAEAAAAEKKAAEEAAAKKAAEAKNKKIDEADFLLAKSYTCPVCDAAFKSLTVKANRARRVDSDIDLRPIYDPIDMLKYQIVSCPECGYSGFARTFPYITANQKKAVREKIAFNFKPDPSKTGHTTHSYEEALERYQMALATDMVIGAKASEKADLCLMMAWVVRGQRKSLDESDPEYAGKLQECRSAEDELLKNALDGFIQARQTEGYPMCGNMDQHTVDYIIAALYYKSKEFDKSLKMLAEILISNSAGKAIKDKARLLKDKIMAIKQAGQVPDQMED